MGKVLAINNPIRVLCLFDYASNTGFATVSTEIVRAVKRIYREKIQLDIVAGSYYGPPYEESDGTLVLPAALIGPDGQEHLRDAYGRIEFLRMLKFDHYDGCFIIQDPDVILGSYENQDGGVAKCIKDILDFKKQNKMPLFKAMYYFPVDCEPMKYLFAGSQIDVFSKVIAYTEFGRKEILKIRPELRSRLQVILHGVDVGKYKPLTDMDRRALQREDYFGQNASKYIVANINRNQYRKDIPATLYAFKEFKEKYCAMSFLYLHMHPHDEMGWNVRQVAEQLGLVENVDYGFPPPEMLGINAVNASAEMLNIIYNICDVYLTTTTGEGFGLTILEAFAAGLPVVAPLHTSISEISGDGERIYGFENFYYYCDRSNNKIVWQSDFEEVAAKLDQAHKDHQQNGNEVKGGKAMDYAYDLQWAVVCDRWVTEFQNLFGSNNVRKLKT